MGWKSSLRSYFIFNKREQRGIVLLSAILIIILLIRWAAPFIWEDPSIQLSPVEQQQLLAARQQLLSDTATQAVKKPEGSQPTFQSFDPNTVASDELVAMGLPSWLADRVVKYRSRVKPFETAEDLLVVYDMDTQWWQAALPYMKIEHSLESETGPSTQNRELDRFRPDSTKVKKHNTPRLAERSISLNEADTTALMQIPGIGSFYASSIVKRRKALGGFLHFEQLLSIYRMRDETMDALARFTYIDSSLIQAININTADVQTLGMHPYLSWSQARAIVNYRKQHGVYRRTDEIMDTDVIPDTVYLKIAPYLTVE